MDDPDTPWKREIAKSLNTEQKLREYIQLQPEELQFFSARTLRDAVLPLGIPPAFAKLLGRGTEVPEKKEAHGPIRLQFIPRTAEFTVRPGESPDPLWEKDYTPVPRLVHRYPNRVLLITTGVCAVYCRYCFRRHLSVGSTSVPGRSPISMKELADAADYIAGRPEIEEVILSGGDPLTLDDEKLADILTAMQETMLKDPSKERRLTFRVATRVPAALPSRITPGLCGILRNSAPLWVVLQCNHPAELTPRAVKAVARLINSGIPIVSQTVLLKGVNDDPAVLARLFQMLLAYRIKPYYLFQTDLAAGISHFRVPLKRSLQIVGSLRQLVSGLAMPTFALDLPGGGGKITLHEEVPLRKTGGRGEVYCFTGPDGKEYFYPAD